MSNPHETRPPHEVIVFTKFHQNRTKYQWPIFVRILVFFTQTLLFLSLGETVTDEECQQFILDADLDGDGKINYEEFYNMMSMSLTGGNKG